LSSIIAEKKAKLDPNHVDLLSRLLQTTSENSEDVLTDTELLDEMMTILLAGHETTANATAFTFYLLSAHPEIEQKVIQEVDEVLGDRVPTFDEVSKLKYLDLVVKESMRIYPPAAQLADRRCQEAAVVGGYNIPEGVRPRPTVLIS